MKSDRFKGALLGLAIGDALGATVEFMNPEQIRVQHGELRDIIGGGWLKLKPGEVTDDTQMTLCVARSLVAHNGFNPHDMADRLLAWYRTDPQGTGKACRSGLDRYEATGETERPFDKTMAGNGVLMRILPFILFYQQEPQLLRQYLLQHAHLTHHNDLSDSACLCYTELILSILAETTTEQLKCCADRFRWQPDQYDGKSGGYVLDTLNTVLFSFFNTDSFEEALIRCVNLGGDADTTGAILGGLAGAFYGYSSIPDRWKQSLNRQVHDELLSLAERLVLISDEDLHEISRRHTQ